LARALGGLGALLACAGVLGGAGTAFAGSFVATLETAAGASHFYQVTCSDDGSGAPASLATEVRALWPATFPLVSVQTKRLFEATNTTDPMGGDAVSSPLAWVDQGAGVYELFVDKTGAGQAPYQLFCECRTGAGGTGVATGTSISPEPPTAAQVPALSPVALLFFALILLAGGAAAAHTQNGALGEPARATDFYQVTCSDDGVGAPDSLVVQLRDTTPAAPTLVSVQVRRGALLSNTTDPVGGDAAASPEIHVPGGAGVYDVLVDKSGPGARSYVLMFHCVTGTGNHTGTSLTTRQNQ
jgi:hypothetical protein